MSDRPIIFSAPMIRALLAGRKTQTRRIIKPQPSAPLKAGDRVMLGAAHLIGDVRWPLGPGRSIVSNKPGPHPRWVEEHVKYAVGDRLYVREAWRAPYGLDYHIEKLGRPRRPAEFDPSTTAVEYLADGGRELGGKVRSPLHMPRWASRLTLLVTDVRVEHLQVISRVDALAEGIFAIRGPDKDGMCHFAAGAGEKVTRPTPEKAFAELWRSINGPESWDANPWVVAVSFDVKHANIDQLPTLPATDALAAVKAGEDERRRHYGA